jgi:hypothetical protein
MHQPPTQPSATGLRDAGRWLVAMFVLGVVPGCLGPAAIRGTRLHYNQAYERTADQELLLNIVRMRYADSPVFIDLPAITSQFEASSNGVGGASSTTRELGYLSGNFLMRDAPTLSYAPRSGREYAKTLFTPLKAEALINTSPGGNTRNFFLGYLVIGILVYFLYSMRSSKLGRGILVTGHEADPMELPHKGD